MIMADVLKFLFLILGALIITVSYWLLFEAIFPRWVRTACRIYQQRPIKTFLLGALTGGPAILITVALLNQGGPQGQFLGASAGIFLLLVSLVGSAGLARLVGEGLPSAIDAQQSWRPVMRGGAVLSICCVLPIAGWFAILPVILLSGFGAVVRTAWQIHRQRRAAIHEAMKAVEA
ncbi:MAG: hypothetical protein HYV27_21390 [Candidatus Hydrogenedentes bacterium]|nr:hypothetical protein [Candidatus Hydrogenedentota bacterium]